MKNNQNKYGFTKKEWNNMSPIRKLERKLDRVNHIMELIRTIVPDNAVAFEYNNYS